MADKFSVKQFFISVFLIATHVLQAEVATQITPTASAGEPAQDFLFLAEEEPDRAEEVPDTKDEEVIVAPAKGEKRATKEKPFQKPPDQNPAYIKHIKIEDKISETLPLPAVYCLKKQMGCFYLSGKYMTEGFGGKDLNFLNDSFREDRAFYMRHTFDLSTDAQCHNEVYGDNIANLKLTLRNKGNWGVQGSVAPTTAATVSAAGVTFGSHTHSLSRHFIWLREAWVQAQINAIFKMNTEGTKHFFKAGFFPFAFGNGIALGAAYAVNQGLVAFYSDYAVDQFAPGLLFTGEFLKDRVAYDVYGAILQNNSNSLSANLEQIYLMRYGRRATPERGFGSVNWLAAARLQLVPWKDEKTGTVEFEPYFLFNRIPEQVIEFPADASSKLITLGFELDYGVGNFEGGIEFAHNLGRQQVHGWDNNGTELSNVTGTVLVVNTKVTDLVSGQKALVTDANQALIYSVPPSEAQNGQVIPGTGLKNASDRFTDPYCTLFKGWMLVGEFMYWFAQKQIGIALGGGIASGDNNPNFNAENPRAPLPDGTYEGFIPLQSIYTGEKVESALFFGQGSIVRPLSLPTEGIEQSFVADKVNGFTNVAYVGIGAHIKPKWKNKLYIRPNILGFWQPEPTNQFDAANRTGLNCPAAPYYGTEVNIFWDIFPIDCIKGSLITGVFFPGSHFREIRGIPTSKDQLKLIKSGGSFLNRTVSNDTAYFLNLRLEYRF
jgi:hypothetical protein